MIVPFKKSAFSLASLVVFFWLAVGLCFNAFAGDIVILGDSQANEDVQRKIVSAIVKLEPLAVFRVGDNVNDGDDPEQWASFKDINRPLLLTTEYFSALGNHEKASHLYFKTFPLLNDRHWYAVERAGIRFIVLDSNSPLQPGSLQYDWLVNELAGQQESSFYRVVLFHHPLFNVGAHAEDDQGLRPTLMPLFKKYGVHIVFSGHEHNYEHFEFDGIYFIVTGGGGSDFYDQKRSSPYLKKFLRTYHFCVLTPGEKYLKVHVLDPDSKTIDMFDVGK